MLQPALGPGPGPGPHPVAAVGACLSTLQNAGAAFASLVEEMWNLKRNSVNACEMQQLFKPGSEQKLRNKLEKISMELEQLICLFNFQQIRRY